MTPTPNPTYDLLVKPTVPPQGASAANLAAYQTVKVVWNKKNSQALSLMQSTLSDVIWQDYSHIGVAKDLFDALETTFRKVGGSIDLPPTGQHGENSIHQFDGSIVPDTTIPGKL